MSENESTKSRRVFLSHSSQDKERLRPIAARLRRDGLDVWFDEWEIAPGDSIVEKINEGLERCDVFMVALSDASVQSRWVKAELDAALVRRIQQQCRLIPLLLEPCDIPPLLKPLCYVNLSSRSLDDAPILIIRAIAGETDKPPLGQRVEDSLGISLDARAVLKTLFELRSATPTSWYWSPRQIHAACRLSPGDVNDAIEELVDGEVIKGTVTAGCAPFKFTWVELAWRAFYVGAEFLDYDPRSDASTVGTAVAEAGEIDGAGLEQQTHLPPHRISTAVDALEANGYLQVDRAFGNAPYDFIRVQPTLRTRMLYRQARNS